MMNEEWNNRDASFEKRLQQIAPGKTPPAWREEILNAAQSSATSTQKTHFPRLGFFQLFQALLARPQRVAWAGLVATWIVIGTLHLATSESTKTTSITSSAAPTTPETLQALKQQRLLYAELVGRPEQQPTERLKTNIPSPRSQRREESAIT
ncbi:MAG: hypothetical protein QM813_15545 [Verrucomicrobiota bacterium]